MKKILLSLLITALLFTLCSCSFFSGLSGQMDGNSSTSKPGDTSTEPSHLTDSISQGITNDTAKELFEKTVNEIIALATEDTTQVVTASLGHDIEVFYEEKRIDGVVYYETTAKYEKLQDYYAEIFTGDALGWILSTKFADVDGILYCSPIGGATGWRIENIEVKEVTQAGGGYIYDATFHKIEHMKAPEEGITSRFTITETEDGYRISSINYLAELSENWAYKRLEKLLWGDSIQINAALIDAFYQYYDAHPYELRLLPEMNEDHYDWAELTHFAMSNSQWEQDHEGLSYVSETNFRYTIKRFFGDIDYTLDDSQYVTFSNGKCIPTGWDDHGMMIYRLKEISTEQSGVIRAVFDSISFDEGDFLLDEDAYSANMKSLMQTIDDSASSSDIFDKMKELIRSDDYSNTFQITDQISIEFQVTPENMIYQSCSRD